MLKEIIALVLILLNITGHNAESKSVYTEKDFTELKSGTAYADVIKSYGGSDDGLGNLLYPLEDGGSLCVTMSIDKEVLFIETIHGNEITRCREWEEREKSEFPEKIHSLPTKSDFDSVNEDMTLDELVRKFGSGCTLIGNGFTFAKYLTNDFEWVIIKCSYRHVFHPLICTSEPSPLSIH